jgi:hypothetical protein
MEGTECCTGSCINSPLPPLYPELPCVCGDTVWFKIRLSSGMYVDYVNGVLYADSKENAKHFDIAHTLEIERELRYRNIEFVREANDG